MSGRYIQWAQALDNTSDDLVRDGGEDVPVHERERRERLVSSITAVVSRGSTSNHGDVRVHAHGCNVVVVVPADQLDKAGRVAPLYLHADSLPADEADENGLMEAIRSFAARIGRTVESTKLVAVRAALAAMKKKRATQQLIFWIICVLGAAILGYVVLVTNW